MLGVVAGDEPEPVLVPLAVPVDGLLPVPELVLDGDEVRVDDAGAELQEDVAAGEVELDVLVAGALAVVDVEPGLLAEEVPPAVLGSEPVDATHVVLVADRVLVVFEAVVEDPDRACRFAPAPPAAAPGVVESASDLVGRAAAAAAALDALACVARALLAAVAGGRVALVWIAAELAVAMTPCAC